MAYQLPIGYTSVLGVKATLIALDFIEQQLVLKLQDQYNLTKITPPMIVTAESGLNDDFRMHNRPVDFDIQPIGAIGELLNSPTKWRRYALMNYDFAKQTGIISLTNTFARDKNDLIKNSLVNKNCGFDLIVDDSQYNLMTIQNCAVELIKIIARLEIALVDMFPRLKVKIYDQVKWISMNHLKSEMRLATVEERINRVTRDNGIIILYDLEDEIIAGQFFDDESQDTYDWEYYAKIYFYNYMQEKPNEIARIGFSVNKDKLADQNLVTKENQKIKTEYDALIALNKLPLTLTCSVDLSVLSMYLLEKQHIGEVVTSIWDDKLKEFFKINNIQYLK